MSLETAFVTPSLFVGKQPGWETIKVTSVDTVAAAVRVIEEGEVALLPPGAWNRAREVLEALGLSEPEVEDRLRFARTGSPGK